MSFFARLRRFIRNVFDRSEPAGTVDDSPEMVLEKERRRGMRGL